MTMQQIVDPRISRYDRSIADNIGDLRTTFGASYEIVFNFLQFFNNNLRFNLFGYSKFTLKDFARERNIRYQTLSEKHPDIVSGRVKAPEINGYKFESFFDYSLYLMYSQKIMFSREYSYKDEGRTIHLTSLSLLSEIKMNFDWKNGNLKHYDIKASSDLLEGNFIRYYTLDAQAERALGKGKNSLKAKEMLWWLCRARHIMSSDNVFQGIYPIDTLAKYVDINVKTNKAKKQAVQRLLERIKTKTEFPFDFEFTNAPDEKSEKIKYYVVITFFEFDVKKLANEHRFYKILYDKLKGLYEFYAKDRMTFSEWLTNNKESLQPKAEEVRKAYEHTYNQGLSLKDALSLINSGIISSIEEKGY